MRKMLLAVRMKKSPWTIVVQGGSLLTSVIRISGSKR